MPTTTLQDLVISQDAQRRLFSCHPKKARDTFRLAQVQRELQPFWEDYEKTREALLEKHCTKKEALPGAPGKTVYQFIKLDEDGEPLSGKDGESIQDLDALNAYSVEMDELLTEGIEITSFITLSLIDRLEIDPPMSPTEMAALMWLIKDKE